MPLEVSENIPHYEAAEVGPLERRMTAAIIDCGEEGRRRRKQIIDRVAPHRIPPRFHIGDPAIPVDREVLDMAFGAAYLSELVQTIIRDKAGRGKSRTDPDWLSLAQLYRG